MKEMVAAETIIAFQLLFDRTIATACISFWFTFMSFYGITYFMPVFLQLMGNSPTKAGLRFVPSSAGVIMRATGKYSFLDKANHLFMILGCGLTASLKLDTAPWHPFVYMHLFGLGFGNMLVTILMGLVSAVEQDNQPVVTSAGFAFRSTGSAIGLTVSSANFPNLLR